MSLMSFTGRSNHSLIEDDEKYALHIHYLMGTFVEIEVIGEKRPYAIKLIEQAFSEMKRIERILSKYLEESEIYRINQFAHRFPVELDSEVFELLEETIGLHYLTNGAFDITMGKIMDIWDLAQKRGFGHTGEEIKWACSETGCANIALNSENNTIFFKCPGVKIDLGGIGKGYAVDRAIDILRRNKIKKTLVNAGGNIFCMDEDYSDIGIKNPLNPDELIATVSVKDKAISTSANYERFFSIEGKNYGHIINPKTGYPVDNNILSVSIISSSAKKADILSTAVFVLGKNEGMKLIESMDDLEGIIIIKEGSKPKLYASSGLGETFQSNFILN